MRKGGEGRQEYSLFQLSKHGSFCGTYLGSPITFGSTLGVTSTAGTSSELAYAIMDVLSNHVFVIDNFTVTPN